MRNKNMLKELKKVLLEKRYQVSSRGAGKSRFLFVKGDRTSAEISEDNMTLWVEFWETSDEEVDDTPVKDKTCKTLNEAIEVISDWIR